MPIWLGVDVGGPKKGFDVALVDARGVLRLEHARQLRCRDVAVLVERYQPMVVGIDGPSRCAPDGASIREDERQLAASVCGIRWTPDRARVAANEAYYSWVQEGLRLYRALDGVEAEVIEVFPTASWTRWFGRRGQASRAAWTRRGMTALGLPGLPTRTNQDERDAIAAAVTARQYTSGLTERFGEIVVPSGPWDRPARPKSTRS
jgi:predicted nuclease with RNAse H fold